MNLVHVIHPVGHSIDAMACLKKLPSCRVEYCTAETTTYTEYPRRRRRKSSQFVSLWRVLL